MKYIGSAISKKPIETRGIVYIIQDRCKGCNICIHYCPREILEESKEFNVKGHHFPKLIEGSNEQFCVNCGYCELVCPEFAIYTLTTEEAKEKVKTT